MNDEFHDPSFLPVDGIQEEIILQSTAVAEIPIIIKETEASYSDGTVDNISSNMRQACNQILVSS